MMTIPSLAGRFPDIAHMLPSWLYVHSIPATKPTLRRADWFTSSFLPFFFDRLLPRYWRALEWPIFRF
jgi:hypothetical protein